LGAAAFGAMVGNVCAHGSAAAGGATTVGTTSPKAVADATETVASLETTDMSPLSRAPGLADVTIVTFVKDVAEVQ
jgi:hypothetical protein